MKKDIVQPPFGPYRLHTVLWFSSARLVPGQTIRTSYGGERLCVRGQFGVCKSSLLLPGTLREGERVPHEVLVGSNRATCCGTAAAGSLHTLPNHANDGFLTRYRQRHRHSRLYYRDYQVSERFGRILARDKLICYPMITLEIGVLSIVHGDFPTRIRITVSNSTSSPHKIWYEMRSCPPKRVICRAGCGLQFRSDVA